MQMGISPKVKIPAWLIGIAGLAVTALGAALGDTTITAVGGGLLAAVGIQFPAGYRAPTGEVKIDIGPPSDSLLSPEAKRRLESDPSDQ